MSRAGKEQRVVDMKCREILAAILERSNKAEFSDQSRENIVVSFEKFLGDTLLCDGPSGHVHLDVSRHSFEEIVDLIHQELNADPDDG